MASLIYFETALKAQLYRFLKVNVSCKLENIKYR
jgi:hypothetical protein